ncbi:hypothetical protein [Pseudoxanthomonas winnipegensis]|uniref:Proteic killer suppression protein n=1 Tax=Pseudoxanthomonas winnipegensis TaxID=2480810 RepID=A0A4Q8LTT3_9GAMM|nr:hypothetical protein [Pseudoxanthomonas winnipegensis]RZZ88149.1 hypothetical protein EA663_04655 [Pseudoxanthomonas winnipegensis]TAA34433.1 hypothetical protein EA656_11895 [Pseudoxanthomonas winnipegensis]
MHITFADAQVRDLCEKSRAAKRHLGDDAAAILHSRLSDLSVAEGIEELPFVISMSGPEKGTIALQDGWLIECTFSSGEPGKPVKGVKIDRIRLHE